MHDAVNCGLALYYGIVPCNRNARNDGRLGRRSAQWLGANKPSIFAAPSHLGANVSMPNEPATQEEVQAGAEKAGLWLSPLAWSSGPPLASWRDGSGPQADHGWGGGQRFLKCRRCIKSFACWFSGGPWFNFLGGGSDFFKFATNSV